MVGYDTVWLHADAYQIPDNDLKAVSDMLSRGGYDKTTGEMWSTGNVGNLKVSVGGGGVSVKGSIAAFLYPDNVVTVGRKYVAEALEKMSDTLHFDVSKARPTRIDVSTSFLMANKPTAYYQLLGGLSYFTRIMASKNTVYYQRGKENRQTLAFYDKYRECIDTQTGLPKVYKDAGNILRYEYRVNGRIAHQLNCREVMASTLADVDFYRKIVSEWAQQYFNIKKTYSVGNMEGIKTVSDAKNFICSYALSQLGAASTTAIISEMKAKKVFQDPKYYTRLKHAMAELSSKYHKADNNDLATELDNDVREELAYI